ncbi:MAG TPA: ATP-binding protein [Candidatus Angelobacter sp.]|nr:ATP-binding protein [Candidatus Angelobacter sp.]
MSKEYMTDMGRRRRLAILVPRFAIVIASVLLLTYALSYAADSLRAYAFATLLWQTTQKKAQLALTRCIAQENLEQFPEFQEQIGIMQALAQAIQAGRPPRNANAIRDGLRRAHISEQDAEKIVRFSGVMSWLNSSVTRKNQEDGERAAIRVQRQFEIGGLVKQELQSAAPNRAHLDQLLRELEAIDAEADQSAQGFVLRTRSLIQRMTKFLFLTIAMGTLVLLYLSFYELQGMLGRLLKTEKNLRRREEQLFEARKLDAIGRLAASVAHDFNNLLMVISSAVEMIMWQLPGSSRQRKLADGILEATRQGSALTRQLLVFSRKQVNAPQILELDRAIEENKQFVQHLLGSSVELHCLLQAGHTTFRIDRPQFSQVLLNLAANARDAMPHGGELIIQTRVASAEEVPLSPQSPDGYVMIQVSDQGEGMSEETKMRIFEPFFTTKPAGKGTGLGLSTVYGIVMQYDGAITVESQPHRGTTFQIFFPVSREMAAPEDTKTVVHAQRASGGETILLVEDQDALRELSRSALELEGYHVITARNCEDAVELTKVYSGPIDLVLTDVVLPKLSGREVARQVRALRPEVRVIYMSGYAPSELFDRGVIEPGSSFLQKPCSIVEIARKVREVLATTRKNQTA